ncbi:hypothetical protein DL96DRAFT_1760973 [Flagelloscypha sp. PMI_526]|nr:hypothetical protein DL96DRAFT_1760973 [Flagelloscypha sp. PMI_526]
MPSAVLPLEIVEFVVERVTEVEDIQTLQALALTAHHFLQHIRPILFKQITFNESARPRDFLIVLGVQPNLASLVKSVILTQFALQQKVQQKALIMVVRQLQNLERITLPRGECDLDDHDPRSEYVARSKWFWGHIDLSVAASLTNVGRRISQMKELILLDISGPPLGSIFGNFPNLCYLQLAWTCDMAIFNGRSLNNEDNAGLRKHLSVNVAENSLPFLLHALKTVPRTAPLENFTLILKELRPPSDSWDIRTDWEKLDEAIEKLVAVVVRRPLPLKMFRIKIFGVPRPRVVNS